MDSAKFPNQRNTILKEWLLASGVFLVLISIFFYPAVFQGKLLYTADVDASDLTDFNIPRRYLVTQAIKDGEFPQWEPLIGCGTTVAADGHPGLFYPFSTPFNLLLPITTAANTSVFCAMYIAFLGCYWLIRLHGAKPVPALLGAIAYAFGGSLIFRLRHLNIIHVIAWLPGCMAMIRQYLNSGKKCWWIWIVLIWSMQLWAGHPQITYICQLSYWVFIITWLAFSSEAVKIRFKRVGILILAGVMALMLGSIQWMPTMEFSRLSMRTEGFLDHKMMVEQSCPLSCLQCLFNPYKLGNLAMPNQVYLWNMGEIRPYWGTIILLFTLGAWGKRTRRMAIFWALVSSVFFWAALGPEYGLYNILHQYLPFFSLFRFPFRMLIPVGLGIAILGALGVDNFCEWLRTKSKHVTTTVMVLFIVFTAAELVHTSNQFQSYLPKEWSQPPALLKAIEPNHRRIFSPLSWKHFNYLMSTRGWLRSGDTIMHMYNELPVDSSTMWNVPVLYDHACINEGLCLIQQCVFQRFIRSNIDFDKTPELQHHISRPILAALRLAMVSHIVCSEPLFGNSDTGITTQTFATDKQSPPFYIYKINDVLPEARLVPSLTDKLPNIYNECTIQLPPELIYGLFDPDPEHPLSIGKCTAVAPTRNTYSVSTECDKDSYLVLARTFHPNWHVSIDGGPEQSLIPVNFAFQAVAVPAGYHQLEFRYSSPALKLGGALSATALVILVIVGFWGRKRSPKDTVPELSTPKINTDETSTKETVAAETSTSETSTTHTNASHTSASLTTTSYSEPSDATASEVTAKQQATPEPISVI